MISAAVIGVGQTNYKAKRRDVSIAGLVREAIDKALLASDVEWDAIDAALCDYADYGDDQAAMSAEIGDKIYRLFKEVK